MFALQFCCLYEISPWRGHMFYKHALSSFKTHLKFQLYIWKRIAEEYSLMAQTVIKIEYPLIKNLKLYLNHKNICPLPPTMKNFAPPPAQS